MAELFNQGTTTSPNTSMRLAIGKASTATLNITLADFVTWLNTQLTALLPLGTIVLWYGTVASRPTGWALCDGGTYGGITTPDLRNVVPVGANTDTGGVPTTTIAGGNTTSGGAANHRHASILQTTYLGSDVVQGFTSSTPGSATTQNILQDAYTASGGTAVAGILTAGQLYTGDAISNGLPPYQAVVYIMKYA